MSALTKKSAKNKKAKPGNRALKKSRKAGISASPRAGKAPSAKKPTSRSGQSRTSTPARPGAAAERHSASKTRPPVKPARELPPGKKSSRSAAPGVPRKGKATPKPTAKAKGKASVPPKASAAARRAAVAKVGAKNRASAQGQRNAKSANVKAERDRLNKAKLKERETAAKLRAKEKLQRDKERESARKLKEQERLRKQREQDNLRAAKAKDAERREREEAKQRALKEREAKRLATVAAREEARQRAIREREAARRAKEEQRQREKAEKEAERELARRQKEEERAKREAEREAYRKAKEAERERIRATKEAQKRALEGRIAEATRNANKLGGGRSSTTRIYSPRAIPDQSGTTRRVAEANAVQVHAVANHVTPVPAPQVTEGESPAGAALGNTGFDESPRGSPPPERPLPTAESVEERYRVIEERLKEAPQEFRSNYQDAIDMSWIYHDSALEGVVYTFQELRAALDKDPSGITDSSLQPVVEEIRRHKAAIDLVRELGEKKRAPITVDVIKKIYLTLHPEEGDVKTVKYRRDIPQHRLYFHEYSHPEKIQAKVRQIVDWLNGPEPKKLKSPIRVASRAHYELLRVFPFQTDSGKVARLFMNLLLLRTGHPPAIVHSTERQRYYESLRGSLPSLIQMVTESILNALISIEKLLDERDMKVATKT